MTVMDCLLGMGVYSILEEWENAQRIVAGICSAVLLMWMGMVLLGIAWIGTILQRRGE